MGSLLFSPSGRIGPSEFMKGMIILGIVGAIISLIGFVSFQLSQILGLAAILLLVPFFFMAVKRSHDSGKSGWMSIVWFIVWLVIMIVISLIIGMLLPSAAEVEMKAALEAAMLDGGGFSEIMAVTKELADKFGPDIAKQQAVPQAAASIISAGAAGWLINMFNPHDLDENQFG